MELWDVLDADGNKTGRLMERGKPILQGDYHLVVFAFIQNLEDQFLISKRTPNKTFPNMWEITGGSAVQGDISETAILREVKEELGISLHINNGKKIKSIRHDVDHPYFADIWHFKQDIKMSEIHCQAEEVSEAKFVTKEELWKLIEDGHFIKNEYILSCLEML